MNKRFLTLQIVILVAFTLLFALTLNPDSISMLLKISESLNWDITVQNIPLIPENTRSQMVLFIPFLMTIVFIMCWIVERSDNTEDNEPNILDTYTAIL